MSVLACQLAMCTKIASLPVEVAFEAASEQRLYFPCFMNTFRNPSEGNDVSNVAV